MADGWGNEPWGISRWGSNWSGRGWSNEPWGAMIWGGDATPPIIEIISLERTKISDEIGYKQSALTWKSNEGGYYTIEVGGTGKGTGTVIETGACTANENVVTYIDDYELSAGQNQVNIYVEDLADNVTPYEDTRIS